MSTKSVEHWEAMGQRFAEHPEEAVAYVRELVRQANEAEEHAEYLGRVNDELIAEVNVLMLREVEMQAKIADLHRELAAALELV